MLAPLLVTTSSEGMQPLGSAAQRSYELVSGTVRQRLGEDHAALFAEPISTRHGDRIDWHTSVDGKARPLAGLQPGDQSRVREKLGQLIADIVAEAGTLSGSDSAEDQRLGQALSNAVEIPSEDMIWAVDDGDTLHPVIVHWAWIRDEKRAVRGLLTGLVPRPAPDPVPLQSAPAASIWHSPVWSWLVVLGWLLLAALLGLILWLMIHPCGLAPWGPDHCRKPGAALAAAFSEQQVTEEEIQRLEHEIALADRACQPKIPLSPAAAPKKE